MLQKYYVKTPLCLKINIFHFHFFNSLCIYVYICAQNLITPYHLTSIHYLDNLWIFLKKKISYRLFEADTATQKKADTNTSAHH